jgi:hypothetical protein
MIPVRSTRSLIAAAAVVLSGVTAVTAGSTRPAGAADKNKPSISLKANPTITFSPATIFFVAEIKGGASDDPELYCASVEWEWGDETKDQSSSDCEPYEPGKSQIKRRFVAQHRYSQASDYRVHFRLKQKDKVVGFAQVNIKIRPGVRDPIGF